jgi:nucleoid-associated protein YgaU
MALMGTAFVALTIILIVFQPGSPRHASNEIPLEGSVTRVAPALDTLSVFVKDRSASGALTQDTSETQAAGQYAGTAHSTHAGGPTTMRDMTFVAISNLKSVTTGEAPAPGEPGSLLHSVVQRSIGAKPVQIEPQAAPVTVAAQPTRRPSVVSYFVLPGDTLVSIAQELYGDANMASELFLKNTDIISRPDSLSVGMVLDLP